MRFVSFRFFLLLYSSRSSTDAVFFFPLSNRLDLMLQKKKEREAQKLKEKAEKAGASDEDEEGGGSAGAKAGEASEFGSPCE